MILALTFGLAGLLSSPDVPSVTVKSWVQADPGSFLATAATELNRTSGSATLGPPYNDNGAPQRVLIAPGSWAGIRQPIDTAQTFVLGPLSSTVPADPALLPHWPPTRPPRLPSRTRGPPTTGRWSRR